VIHSEGFGPFSLVEVSVTQHMSRVGRS
jgi:hypothetical protein